MTRGPWEPLYCRAPARARTHGDLAAGLGTDLGWDLDPLQRWSLDAIFAEDERGLPASGEFAVVGPRQTVGKTVTLECAAIADVDLFGAPLHVWTAHEFKTSRKAYADMRQRLLAHEDYRDRVDFRDAHGEEAIFFAGGGTIEFHARSGSSGRGFTTSRITLDEALYLRPGDLGALCPTGVTMPDFQVRYGSSAGKLGSEALREVRDRGRAPEAGEDLAYLELGAPRRDCADAVCEHRLGTRGCALEDRELWWRANSGWWFGRVDEAALAKQRRMLAASPAEFAREFLSWWEDPAAAAAVELALDGAAWAARLDAGSVPLDPVALAVDVTPSRSASSVSMAGWRADGRKHVERLASGRGTSWVVDWVLERVRRWDPVAVALDPGSQAGSLLEPLRRGGIDVTTLTAQQVAAAAGTFDSDVREDGLRHRADDEVDQAVEQATWRNLAGARAFARGDGGADISGLVAESIAAWALVAKRPRPSAPAAPQLLPRANVADLEGGTAAPSGERAGQMDVMQVAF